MSPQMRPPMRPPMRPVGSDEVSFLHCDTTYSDPRAPDQRGRAVAAVTAVSSGESACVRIRGVGARAEVRWARWVMGRTRPEHVASEKWQSYGEAPCG